MMIERKRIVFTSIALAIITGFGFNSISDLVTDFDDLEHIGFSLGLKQMAYVYLVMPIIIISSSLFILGPGFHFALLKVNSHDGFCGWVLKGFVFSVLIVCGLSGLIQWLFMEHVLTGGYFYLLLLLLNIFSLLCLIWADHREAINWQIFNDRGFQTLIVLATPMVVLALLSSKFYWESFNGDGAHSFLSAWLMITKGVPFWSADAGGIGSYPSMTTMLEVFLNSWFIRLFGLYEFSVRAIFPLGLGLVFVLILEFIRFGRDEQLSRSTILCISAALVLYSFVLAFNTSYDFYFADIALPMGREPIIVLVFLGFTFFAITSQFFWMGVYAFLIYITVPSGPFYILSLLLAMLLLWRPIPLRVILYGGISLLLAIAIGKLIPAILSALNAINGEDEFSSGNLLERLRYVSFQNWERLAYWALPTGILPSLAVLAWRWQDRLTRTISLVTIGYVCLFYFQAYRVLPHHFAPAMLLSLIVLWRLKPLKTNINRKFVLLLSALGVIFSAWVSWPPLLKPHTYARQFSQSIFIMDSNDKEFNEEQIYIFHELMRDAFPGGWTEEEGKKYYIFSPLSWYYYAIFSTNSNEEAVYRVEKISQMDNQDSVKRVVSQFKNYQLSIESMTKYEKDRINHDIKRSINDLYFVKREIIFGKGEKWNDRRVIDLARLPSKVFSRLKNN